MNTYTFKDFKVEVVNDPDTEAMIADDEYYASRHTVKVYSNETEIASCVLLGTGGATGVYEDSSLLDEAGEQVVVCCGDTVFCLALPSLELKWKNRADDATCFRILWLEGNYLVHGEIEITCLTPGGQVKWKFSGFDIFVSMDGEPSLTIAKNVILLRDFNGTPYTVDFNGNEIHLN